MRVGEIWVFYPSTESMVYTVSLAKEFPIESVLVKGVFSAEAFLLTHLRMRRSEAVAFLIVIILTSDFILMFQPVD